MKNPETGESAPGGGASGDLPRQDGADGSAGGQVAGRWTAAVSGSGAAGDAHPKSHKSRKRRRRKRGRKVFARDANGAPSKVETTTAGGAARPAPDENVNGADGVAAAPAVADSALRQRTNRVRPGMGGAPAGGVQGARPRQTGRDLPVYAALDLGTNNCRLLVAIPARPGQFRVIDAFSRIVRLGEGLTASGRLSEAAIERALEALKVCADKLGNREVRRARLIATEACRSAANGAEFLERVEERTGLQLEIIDRRTEARLAVSGCGSLVERETDAVVLFDIGGGSSEIALVDVSERRSPRLANHIVAWTSLPVGVVSLAERFGGRDVTPEIYEAMVNEVERLLAAFDGRGRLDRLAAGPNFHLLGTSGTVTTLAGVHLGLERYDRRRVDGLWMSSGDVDAMIDRLLGWEFHERVANPCIGADRADLVLAGCAILEAIRRVWPAERLRVADRGLREGILTELMADDGVWRRGRGRFRPNAR